jgi:hypothetical protein
VLEEELACGEDSPRGSVADEVLVTSEEGDRSEAVSLAEGPTGQPLGVVLPWYPSMLLGWIVWDR